jgi:hypothetical protein
MIQILRHITIRKGGAYVHWDALDARSEKGTDAKALGNKIAASHAHATRMHKGYVRETVAKLFRDTPNDEKLCFVKEEVFGIKNGAPIISPDHPVMREMFEQPITGALCCFPWNFVVKYPDRCAGLVGNYKSKVLFEKAESDDKGETTVLQNRMHPSQQKFFDFLGKHISLHSVAYLYCNVGLELRPICDVGLGTRPFCFEIPISLFHVSF